METPLVSVIYPAFNDFPEHIKESMDSLINQDYPNLEIIVIDDSTNPASIAAIDRYKDHPGVIILRSQERMGLPKALNRGLNIAKGTYIARADADDIQFPDRISTQVDFLEKNESIGIVGSNVNYIASNGDYIKERKYPETDKSIRRYLHLRNPLCNPVVTIRKEVFDRIGFYDTGFLRSEDYELWFRASANDVQIYNIQKVLLNYRVASAIKRDKLNWHMTLQLKKKYFSKNYILESLFGIVSVYIYGMAPLSIQNFVYKKLV